MQAPAQPAVDRHNNFPVEQAQTNHEEDINTNKCHACCDKVEPYLLVPKSKDHLFIFIPFWASVIGFVIWFFVWAFPRIVEHAFEPATEAIQEALTPVQIGVVICFAVCLLPITIILPKEPFVWLAAVVFNFPEALAMVLVGTIVGMALPFIITRIWFRKSVLKFLHRYRYTAAMLLGVQKAGPFKTTVIMRLGPVPYSLVNYLMAIPEHMPFWKYETASIIGAFPGVLLGVIFGRNIKGLAAMVRGEKVPGSQMAYNLVSLGCTILLLVGGYIYAKRSLAQLEKEAQEAEQQQQMSGGHAGTQHVAQQGDPHGSHGTAQNSTYSANHVIPPVTSDPHVYQPHGVMTSINSYSHGDQQAATVTGVPFPSMQQHYAFPTQQYPHASSYPNQHPFPHAYPYPHTHHPPSSHTHGYALYQSHSSYLPPVSSVPVHASPVPYADVVDHTSSMTASQAQTHNRRPS